MSPNTLAASTCLWNPTSSTLPHQLISDWADSLVLPIERIIYTVIMVDRITRSERESSICRGDLTYQRCSSAAHDKTHAESLEERRKVRSAPERFHPVVVFAQTQAGVGRVRLKTLLRDTPRVPVGSGRARVPDSLGRVGRGEDVFCRLSD
jgi:hypothetical protein